ncbi:ABC transporter permease [Thermobifida halotolerans]|uniref:Transport permease protein n=1 Tax=Thermobifida halotolerans TaxID=483545 RepID=A0AA97LYG5_9ACTN|nr:ABC transporter permease [Thermobifida halotolerans]UOE20389.1 ABC transporter permease [Thermobifida halotolerans]
MTATTARPRADIDERLSSALAPRARPPRPGPLTASLVFGWRALLKIKHVPEQLFDVTVFPVLFLLMFTYLFGGALAGSPREYLQTLLPGILVMNVVMITMYTAVTLNTDITRGIFDRFRSLPVWRPAALAGALLGDAVRYTAASSVVVALGLVLGFRPQGGVVGVLLGVALLVVFCYGFSWVWTVLGLVLRTPNSVMGVSMMVLFPGTFLTNVFVDPATMPGWLRAFVEANPVTHLVTAVRGLMHGSAATGQVALVLAEAAALVAVFAPLTLYLYNRRS